MSREPGDARTMSAAEHLAEAEKLLTGARADMKVIAATEPHEVGSKKYLRAADVAHLAIQAAEVHVLVAAEKRALNSWRNG